MVRVWSAGMCECRWRVCSVGVGLGCGVRCSGLGCRVQGWDMGLRTGVWMRAGFEAVMLGSGLGYGVEDWAVGSAPHQP